MCGEHFNAVRSATSPQGSSPHVRGTLGHRVDRVPQLGIIPACAGNTIRFCGFRLCFRDHPRMCGEHMKTHDAEGYQAGSSPHVRGTLYDVRPWLARLGIIPACAGNTFVAFEFEGRYRDHPRMCGEHRLMPAEVTASTGSSPHVRGTRLVAWCDARLVGIIPACAGNTMPCRRIVGFRGDHPRMCGEHHMSFEYPHAQPGSSPHVRGTRCWFSSCVS